MAYWHSEKYDTLCQRNFSINGNDDSFEFLPQYIKDSITDVTLIMQRPVFEFKNGFKLVQECTIVNDKMAWRSILTLGDFTFFDIPDCNFKNVFPSCKRFSDVIGAFSLIPSSDTEAWATTLKNARRRTWKTSEEVLSSAKFQKVFDKALSEAMELNNANIPMLIPDISEDKTLYKSLDRIKYSIKYVFGLEVKSYKYKMGYFVYEDSQSKPVAMFDDISSLNLYLQSKLQKYELSLEKTGDDKNASQEQTTSEEHSKPEGQKTKKASSTKRNKRKS